jgi:hypothetical protein
VSMHGTAVDDRPSGEGCSARGFRSAPNDGDVLASGGRPGRTSIRSVLFLAPRTSAREVIRKPSVESRNWRNGSELTVGLLMITRTLHAWRCTARALRRRRFSRLSRAHPTIR